MNIDELIEEIEYLKDQLLLEQQSNKYLKELLFKKERELTAVSDRLNKLYLSNRANLIMDL